MLRTAKSLFFLLNKVFIVALVLIILANLFMYFISSDKSSTTKNPYEESRNAIYQFVYDPANSKTKEEKYMTESYRVITCLLIGEACTNNPKESGTYYDQSLMAKMSNLIAMPYANPPASGTYWVLNGMQKAGFIPETYAAEGIGFNAIKPYMEIWKRLRDLAYMLLVLVMVCIGFMIMFRMKLNPQTVISVESALPKIIMSLLYITFSFAIAGFLIDFMYILIVVGVSVLSKADPSLAVQQVQNQYLNANFGTIWDSMYTDQSAFSKVPFFGGFATLFNLGDAIVGILPQWINDTVKGLALLIVGNAIFTFVLDKVGATSWATMFDNVDILGNSLGQIPGGVIGIVIRILLFVFIIPLTLVHGAGWIIGIIIAFTMLLLLFRIFFLLFMSYLKILLLIVFAPIFLLFEALGKHAFSYWFKALLTELLIFPVVIFLIVLGRILTNITITSATPVWSPPFLHAIDPKNLAVLIGMGIIFMIPELVKLTRDFMGAKGLPVGLQLGTFFSGAGAGLGGAMGISSQFYTINHGLTAIFGHEVMKDGIKGMFGKLRGGGGDGH